MRPLLLALITLFLLPACSSQGAQTTIKPISQSGTLKVHPGLRGAPVPPELQDPPAVANEAAAPAEKP